MSAESRIILVTGCSTGIGRALVRELHGRGHRVYASARKLDALADLAAEGIATLASDDQRNFLKEHHLAVLATGRNDGSPQVSTVMYDYDGTDFAISIKSYTAKWKNVLRQPKVGLVINEGRKQLIVYGTAQAVEADPERMELTRRVFRRVTGDEPGAAEQLKPLLDGQKRTALRIIPESVFMND